MSENNFKDKYNKLENIVKEIENTDQSNIEKIRKLYEEGIKLKDECFKIINQEKENIKEIAKKNNISLEEIGLKEKEEENKINKENLEDTQ